MHRFAWYPKDARQAPASLVGAHLLGADNVPVRGEIAWTGTEIRCTPRTPDPIGLSLLWRVDGFGVVQLQTTRLPVRERPYNLHVELARHQLMRLSSKREEWGLFDYNGMEEINADFDRARAAFVASLQQIDDGPKAARLADDALAIGLHAGEKMARFHASVFLSRRQQTGGFGRPHLGVTSPRGIADAALAKRIAEFAQFVQVPFVWRNIQPTENAQQYDATDATVRTCANAGLTLRGGPLLNFGVRSVPDWMYIWENDFEAIYEATREHVERTVRRYAKQVSSWIAVSGLHADNVFGFSFEQVMELTRMAATVIKQHAPRVPVLIEISQPWGEYYARNQQTVPPLLYADMAVQSGVNFDAFGMELVAGIEAEGYHVRDLLAISALIDKIANLGKPIHVTTISAPTICQGRGPDGACAGGEWREPWSDDLHAEYMLGAVEIALSKPYVDTVCIQPLIDASDDVVPSGGLLREDLTARPIVDRLKQLRARYSGEAAK